MFNWVKIDLPTDTGIELLPELWKEAEFPVVRISCTFNRFFNPKVMLIFFCISV
jgi:hypothetical protein